MASISGMSALFFIFCFYSVLSSVSLHVHWQRKKEKSVLKLVNLLNIQFPTHFLQGHAIYQQKS